MNLIARSISALGLLAAAVSLPCAPAANADPASYPVAQGDFTTPGDPGWIFFIPTGFDGRGCGIGPDGTVGCDFVPARGADGAPVQAGVEGTAGSYSCEGGNCPLPPPGTNQTVAGPQAPGRYVHSDSPSFTRQVSVLPQGQQLVNGAASCRLSPQGTLSCTSGNNGFTLNAAYGILDRP